MELKLAGHTAVIVGGAKGIGQAIGLAFAAEGATRALVDRDPEATATAKKIGEQKRVRSGAIVADATSYKAMQTVAKQVATIFRRIDHIVYAVGIGSGKYGFPF